MTTVAIMQPYFFPYLGYFELLAHADLFVSYDDAAFSKNSWYNRNRILGRGREWDYIGFAVQKAPLGTLCQNVLLAHEDSDRSRIHSKLEVYRGAPHYTQTSELVLQVLEPNDGKLCSLAKRSIGLVAERLGLSTPVVSSSNVQYDRSLNAEDKVLDICRALGADRYLNLSGGRDLYDPEKFRSKGISLGFCLSHPFVYRQGSGEFIPNLSVVDALMWLDPLEIKQMLLDRHLDF